MSLPHLTLTRNGEPIHDVSLGGDSVRQSSSVVVNELQPYGFEIDSREADVEYGLWIGDVEAGRCTRRDQMPASTIGIPRGRLVLWDDALYFDGSRGLVWIRACSRATTDDGPWKERALLPVIVASGKLSAERYASMIEQMSGLAAGLVLDLVSKTLRTMRLSLVSSQARVRTSAVELRMLETIWPVVAENLQQIATSPERRLRRRIATRNCWGSEQLDARSVVTLTRFGNDPRHRSASLPFRTQISMIEESLDTFEHRVIRGFLDLLHQRACECHENVERHIAGLERDRTWRDLSADGRESLYSLEDMPRLERLRSHRQRARELIRQLARARRVPPLGDVRPLLDMTATPVFLNVEPYRRIRHELLKFVRTGMVIVEDGTEERVKDTGRLYEQWVFLQLAAAFRQAGLTCASQQGILHTSRVFRFTLDLDRGARVTFTTNDGRAVVLRYEPWVMPKPSAIHNRDSVYRGREGRTAWSPDVLIEFLAGVERAGRPAPVEYAVVVDAKYTRVIREHHWNNTTNYLEIRATADDRQVVRQQWLSYPGLIGEGQSPMILRDSTLRWTENGPDCPRDETLQGTLALTPPQTMKARNVADNWITEPERSASQFVTALLRYMSIDVG